VLLNPSIKVTDEGEVQTAGKVLTTVPVRQWFRLKLEFGLGFESLAYIIAVLRPDKPAERFANLPYVNRAFSGCSWLEIMSNSVTVTRFHADNVRLEKTP